MVDIADRIKKIVQQQERREEDRRLEHKKKQEATASFVDSVVLPAFRDFDYAMRSERSHRSVRMSDANKGGWAELSIDRIIDRLSSTETEFTFRIEVVGQSVRVTKGIPKTLGDTATVTKDMILKCIVDDWEIYLQTRA